MKYSLVSLSENLRPRIIIEGTDFAGTKDIALALSKHPRIVGRSWERCFTAVISAKWCSFSQFPWGDKLIDFSPGEEKQAMQNYRTWVSLIELQRHTGWIIDRFHLTTCKYQLLHYQAEYAFDWLEERMKKLCFHQVLVTQDPRALREAMDSAGRTSQHGQYDTVIQEQNLLRQLASKSILPTIEIEVPDNDIQRIADRIADWAESIGANIAPEDYAMDHVILPSS
jgi:hypothetical protein